MKQFGFRCGIAPKPASYPQKEMMQNISIRQPCAENWDAMQPDGEGRRCMACATTVKDFTTWTPEKIIAYLNANASAKVCGRFRTKQLNDNMPSVSYPELAKHIDTVAISFTKKIALIVLVVLGISSISCNDERIGKAIVNEPAQPEVEKYKTDSIVLLGEVIIEK